MVVKILKIQKNQISFGSKAISFWQLLIISDINCIFFRRVFFRRNRPNGDPSTVVAENFLRVQKLESRIRAAALSKPNRSQIRLCHQKYNHLVTMLSHYYCSHFVCILSSR